MKSTNTDDLKEKAAERIRCDLTFIPALAATDTLDQGRRQELERLARELAQHRYMLRAAQRYVAAKEDEILQALTRDWSAPEVEAVLSRRPLSCGCHCKGGCGDPYAACMHPCPKHIPF